MLNALVMLAAVGLFLAMLASLEAGFRAGRWLVIRTSESALEGTGAIQAAIFGLLGLLLAFAFAGGMSRLDARRELMVREVNAIGTAYLRVDLMPVDQQPAMRALFRDYLDSRLRFYEKLRDRDAALQEWDRTEQLQNQIWSRAIAATRDDPPQNIAKVLLPALNDMIDITTNQSVALFTHLPALIFALLIAVSVMAGFLGGYGMAVNSRRNWLPMIVFAASVSATIYVLVDLDFPRFGLIGIGAAEKAMADLRSSMK